MPRRPNQYIQLDGPLFEDDVIRRFNDAVAEGMEELGDEGASILGGAIAQRGFVRSGRFLRGIEAAAKRTGRDIAGYVSIKVTDAYPTPDRPTLTWFERGTRRGVRLRSGGYGFRKTATALRAMDFDPIFTRRLSEALNG